MLTQNVVVEYWVFRVVSCAESEMKKVSSSSCTTVPPRDEKGRHFLHLDLKES